MNDYVNISQVAFPAVTITSDAIGFDSEVIDGDLSLDEYDNLFLISQSLLD